MMQRRLRRAAVVTFLPVGPLIAHAAPAMREATVTFIFGVALLSSSAVLLALAGMNRRIIATQRMTMSALMSANEPAQTPVRLRPIR